MPYTKMLLSSLRYIARHGIGLLSGASLLFGTTLVAHAATNVSGAITASTTWTAAQGPYTVMADITIGNNAVLTIEAGTVVRMETGTNLIVGNGALRAIGTVDAPVVVTAAGDIPNGTPIPGGWGQIVFMDDTNDAATLLQWVQVRYGKGIRIEASSPTLNDVALLNNAGAAITVDLQSSPTGRGLVATGNAINGIAVPAGEIANAVQWRLLGIPYVVAQGEVSVGAAPRIVSIAPAQIQQGQTLDAVLAGTRLAGVESVGFDAPGVNAVVQAGASDTSIPVRITATPGQSLGAVPLTAQVAAGRARYETGIVVIPAKPMISVTGVSPAELRREESKSFQITGSSLAGAQVSVPAGSGLTLSGLQTTDSQATFTLAAGAGAALGTQLLTVVNPAAANGTGAAAIVVGNAYPKVYASPSPLAVPPDGGPHSFALRLTNADSASHTINLSTADTSVARVSPATIVIPAGNTLATATVTGIKAGSTVLTISSPTIAATTAPIYVTTEFSGINTSYSLPLGIVLGNGAQTGTTTTVAPVASHLLGVVVGSAITSVAPKNLVVGTGPIVLSIAGIGLETAQSVSIAPPDGVTVGALSVAPDGGSVSVPVSIASNAPTTVRQVMVANTAGKAIPAADPAANRIQVVLPAPEVESIDPLFAQPGTAVTLTVRGRNLQSAQSVSMTPATGISVAASPTVNADGTALTVAVNVAANAPTGSRIVLVDALGGSSSAIPSPTNTFRVASQVGSTVTPISSPVLGVVLDAAATPTTTTTSLFAKLLGVSLGSIATGIAPATGAIGETVSVVVSGTELQAVTALQVTPNTGLTVGSPIVAVDGKSVTFSLTIAADAPQTPRTVRLLAGATPVPYAGVGTALFTVTAPQPRIDGMDPIVASTTGTFTLTVRGANFKNAQQVRLIPPDNVSVSSPPVVNADGSQLTVTVVTAGAIPGPRIAVVGTPAGETSATASAANVLTFASTPLSTLSPLVSPVLGVVIENDMPPSVLAINGLASPLLGVTFGEQAASSSTVALASSQMGVALGPIATRVGPSGLAVGDSGTLVVTGSSLSGVTSISLNPSQGVTIGSPLQIAADGSSVAVPISIATDAAATPRAVVLNAGATKIPFANPAANQIQISSVPDIVSMSPILGYRGTTLTLTITGHNLHGGTVSVTPPEGVIIGNSYQTSADGTQLSVSITLEAEAPLTPRVVQVIKPGAASSETATPANTFNVYAP